MNKLVAAVLMMCIPSTLLFAQDHPERSKAKAMWLSAAVPGLGEWYLADWQFDRWGGGSYYTAAEAVLWSGHFFLAEYADWLRQDARVHAAARAGVQLSSSKPARYYVNIGKFQDIQAYNELQRRATGRVFLYEETPENNWAWESEAARKKYDRLRIRSDNTLRTAQYLFFGMIANRVLSLVSTSRAFRNQHQTTQWQVEPIPGGGLKAGWTVHFYSQTLHQ